MDYQIKNCCDQPVKTRKKIISRKEDAPINQMNVSDFLTCRDSLKGLFIHCIK